MYIAFDIGNVLVEFNLDKYIKKLSHYSGHYDLNFFLEINQIPNDLGITNMREAIRDKLGIHETHTIDELLDCWNSTLTINKKMLSFLNKIKEQGSVALLSNMGMDHAKFLRENHPELLKDCYLHFSYEVGARKPQKLFYQSFLQENPFFRYNGKFIDDLVPNLEMAEKMGFKTKQFQLNKFINLNEEEQNEALVELEEWIFEGSRMVRL